MDLALVLVVFTAFFPPESLALYRDPQLPLNAKQLIVAFLQGLQTGDLGSLDVLSDRKFINHNLDFVDGKAGLAAAYEKPIPGIKINVVRAFQEDPYVFVHTQSDMHGLQVRWDVFRFENGKAVEHWENAQTMPATPNGAGHTMIDGPTKATDLELTKANKALVENYVNDVVADGKKSLGAGYFNHGQYIQHNPAAHADGYNASAALFSSLPAGTKPCSRVRYLMGEGNFVLVMCDGTFGTNATAFYDLYRVENGKIAEQWDVYKEIPPCSQWKNMNGKF